MLHLDHWSAILKETLMKKKDCVAMFPHLFKEWKSQRSPDDAPAEDIGSSEMYYWIKENYPRYLEFRSTMGPLDDFDRWYNAYTNQRWKD